MVVMSRVLQYKNLTDKWAAQTHTSTYMLLAIIQMESGGNALASRHEPNYLVQYGSSDKFKEIEKITKYSPKDIATSYGLMQLMIPTAWGFLSAKDKGPQLIQVLYTPDSNIRYGAAFLASVLKNNNGDVSRYNGVGPRAQKYARNVMALTREYEQYFKRGR